MCLIMCVNLTEREMERGAASVKTEEGKHHLFSSLYTSNNQHKLPTVLKKTTTIIQTTFAQGVSKLLQVAVESLTEQKSILKKT